MPATNPTTLKLTEAERDRLRELGRLWGEPERPMSMAEVVRRLLNQAHAAANLTGTQTPNRNRKPKE